ncbi:tetratricopeptide repeat protein [Aeromonas sp. MrichA-1]|uniref:tetratricopeptide repeat protein n=1 Tax=Aeromonas sp. MrichA-1 TaxID=2823362 RepID=UPI001B32C222|nr:tetratricopeptide repeat protein [Aeromonas sp. MrichA-1]MBP4081351.1 sel1 repeat family protein [Aeromonas sp. MrichA-1]
MKNQPIFGRPFYHLTEIVTPKKELSEDEKNRLYELKELYQQISESDNAEAEYRIAMAYYHGGVVDQDYGNAVMFLENSSKKGFPDAQNMLGMMYFNGLGVEQDYHKSLMWLKEAANQGHEESQFKVGIFYFNGFGVEKDLNEAAMWFKAANNSREEMLRQHQD